MAHVIMNGDQKWGSSRMRNAKTASPIEPTQQALGNPTVRAAYDSSMKAAREAYLSGTDQLTVQFFPFRIRLRTARITYFKEVDRMESLSARSPDPTTTPFQTDECLRTLRSLIAISISKTTA
jgi:hypothetical protein